MNLLNIPQNHILYESDGKVTYDFDLTIFKENDYVKFEVGDVSTSWIKLDDSFLLRIQFEKLNPNCLKKHLICEIRLKNLLDDGFSNLGLEKYPKVIKICDNILEYDENYAVALMLKSKGLYGQGHFVKSLRYYKKAIKADESLKNVEYHKMLLKSSSAERDEFPKLKRNIYAGDEYFAKGDYKKAIESYDKALVNPSKFKEKILYKLLNKKATALLKLGEYVSSYEFYQKSIEIFKNDFAYFGSAYALYLNADRNGPRTCLDGVYIKNIKESLNNASKINKRYLIKKIEILNDIGEPKMALKSIDEFLNKYFTVDDDYNNVLAIKNEIKNYLGDN